MSRLSLLILTTVLTSLLLFNGCWMSPSDQDLSLKNGDHDDGMLSDTAAPSVSLVYPREGDVVSGDVVITAEASDDSDIFRVEFFIDGVCPENGIEYYAPYECAWTTNPFEDESVHIIYAKAVDDADNVAFSDTISITVNNSNTNSSAILLNEDMTAAQIFPPDNWWHRDISAAPVDPESDSILDWIGTGRRLHADFGPPPYGIPYIGVPSGQQRLSVMFYAYPTESDPGAPGFPEGYPIPDIAYLQPNYIEGGDPGGGASGDRHMIIVDRDNKLLFETFGTSWNSDAQRWQAACGAVFNLESNERRPEGWTSADAAGLAIFPGLVKYDEVYGPDEIDHALRFTARASNGYVWPASHDGGATWGAPPMGMRIRLKSSFDISGYAPEMQKILRAMKRYGLILADNGSDMYIQGTMDARWDSGLLNDTFHSIYADDFEVIILGWRPTVSGIPTGQPDSGSTGND